MKNNQILAFSIILSIVLVAIPSHAFFNNDVKKAKEFIKADMYPQAIELLNKRIADKPTDADAHFLLGTCFLKQGNIGKADQRYESAVKLDPKLGMQVAQEYMKSGKKMMNNGSNNGSIRCFKKAVSHNASYKQEITLLCLKKASTSSSGQDALRWLNNCEYFSDANNSNREALFRISALKAAELWPKKSYQALKVFAKKYDDGNKLADIFPSPKQETVYSSGPMSVRDYSTKRKCLELIDWNAIRPKVSVNDKVFLLCKKDSNGFYHAGIRYNSGKRNIGNKGWVKIEKGFYFTIGHIPSKGFVFGWIDPKIPDHDRITIEAIIKRDVPQKPNKALLMAK